MDEIISFDKSLQVRLSEYEDLFSGLAKVPYSAIKTEWSCYLELTVDRSGWQAVWKIPRMKCEELKISFPTIVLIYVLDITFSDLSALVRILAVQDEIHLPEKHYVPLAQLWPTKCQDKSIALNINSTANVIDMFRFFYIHLLMPWDEDEDLADWKHDHLVSRLRLYYDLRNGKIPKAMCEHIQALLNEARRLSCKRDQLSAVCGHLNNDIDERNDMSSDKEVESLIEINVRLIEIQNEMNLLENELFRKVILNRQQSRESPTTDLEEQSHIWIISRPGTPANYIALLNFVDTLYRNELVSFAPNLMSKLETASANDIILLNSEEHLIKSEEALIENCLLKGIYNNQRAQITSLAENVMFDCVGSSVVLENITFDCKKSQCALLVRKGHVTLKNCQLIGDDLFTTHHGILVLSGGKLSLESCSISGFSTAIIGNTGSSIAIEKCEISKALCGILVHYNCQLKISQSSIDFCKDYGIVVETDEEFSPDISGSGGTFDILKTISYITVEDLQGKSNGNGDVAIKKYKIKAIADLFENPEIDPTILEDSYSDECMEFKQDSLNNTVINAYE